LPFENPGKDPDHGLTNIWITMWATSLPPIAVGAGYLAADAATSQLYRFNISITRSWSHFSSP
jgi:hypothetical protein